MASNSRSRMQVNDTKSAVTVQDVVLWKQEEAFRMGEIGFDMGFPDMNEIISSFSYDHLDPNGAEDDAYLVQAAMDMHDSVRQFQQHQQLMRENPAVIAAATRAVDQQLVALKRASKEKERRTLREKVVELTELKHPKPKPNYVTVWVNAAGLNQMMEINLPLKATVFEVNDIFRKVIQSELSYLKSTVRPDMPVDDQGGMWKYQLLSHDLTMVINKTSVLLETDNDYSKMIKIVSKGGQAPIAVLTQGKLVKPATTSGDNVQKNEAGAGKEDVTMAEGVDSVVTGTTEQEDDGPVWDDDGTYPGLLDMDGNPYFDPITPENNARAEAKTLDKLQKYGWGDWPSEDDEEEKKLIDRMVARAQGL